MLGMSEEQSIPLIDFDKFLNGSHDDRKDVASAIDAAFRSVGFIYLRNHGIDGDKIDHCFRWVSLYFLFLDYNLASFAVVSDSVPSPRGVPFSTT